MSLIYNLLVGNFNAGAKEILQTISERQGKQMSSVESAKDILKFVEFFKVWYSAYWRNHSYAAMIALAYLMIV